MTTDKLSNRLMAAACLLLCLLHTAPAANTNTDSQPCTIKPGLYGKCSLPRDCPELESRMSQFGLVAKDVVRCGFNAYEEIICCPVLLPSIFNTSQPFLDHIRISEADLGSTLPAPMTLQDTSGGAAIRHRKAIEACRAIENIWEPRTRPLILSGVPVAPGEYPHMAAIGYSDPPYDFRCGGALIDKRFVLTAAHCVNTRELQPAVVRLGVTDLSSATQIKNGIDALVKGVHLHPNYNSLEKHDDIALIELTEDVQYNSLVIPACLHTETADPLIGTKLNVTGWGATNFRTRQTSKILLQARVQIVPLQNCNETFVRDGNQPKGIFHTQLCTQDPVLNADACSGDSGGPLNLIIDELHPMRIIGVVSAGIGCGSITPGLYTRVASYLDFIEDIVWS